MSRVLVLSQYYEEGVPIPASVAEGLTALGHEVEVLTAFPHYKEGRIASGYRQRPWLRETINGIRVTRLPLYPSHDQSAARRVLTYASFGLSAALLGRFLIKRPDVIYVYHPPTTTGMAALWLRQLRPRRIPILYHVQDLWPEAAGPSGMVRSGATLRAILWASRFVYGRVDRTLAISPGFKRVIASHGVDPETITVLYNWAEEHQAKPVPADPELAREKGMTGRFNVVYAGNMGTVQDLDSVLEGAKLLAETESAVQFLLIGGGTEEDRLKARVAEEDIANVRLLPRCSPDEVARVIGCADASLVHLASDPVFDVWIPGKTQASLAMGKPVLMGIRGDAAELVAESGGGICFEPSNPRALAGAVRELLALEPDARRKMGERARAFYMSRLSRATALETVNGLVEEVTRRGRR